MSDELLMEQSAAVGKMIAKLMRQFNALCEDDPAIELPLAQLRLCGVLKCGPRAMSELSKRLGISLSAVTQMADRLERGGLIERVPGADDKRMKTLRLTAKGDQIMQQRREKRLLRVRCALEQMSPETRETTISALKALLDASLTANSEASDAPAALNLFADL